jgi:uncharacterized protein YbjT (DUF2867 family)
MILVTGGTGFVGRHLVARLVGAGREVRVLARREARVSARGEAELPRVGDPSAVASAARGCEAVVHLVGVIRERRGASFRRVHVHGTETVVRACREAGVERLLHMSALGARLRARSRYHRTKWRAEEVVRASGLAATVFRPSVIFGAGNSFLPRVRALARRRPLIPIIGDGMRLLQPIWVEDVVSCFVGALDDPSTAGRAYALGGPESYGFEQLVDLVAETEEIQTLKVHLPVWLMRPAVWAMSRAFPNFPITSDQLTMLREDNVCDIAEMRATFGIEPASIRDHLAD